MNSNEPNVAPARPRRFLILMSLAIIAFYGLRAGITPEAEYRGFGLTLARPELGGVRFVVEGRSGGRS